MKKNCRIGMIRRIGKSGEKYIYFDKNRKGWSVIVPTGKIGGQKRMGSYKEKGDAVLCRDKYLSDLLTPTDK